jgi:hypothetical protein
MAFVRNSRSNFHTQLKRPTAGCSRNLLDDSVSTAVCLTSNGMNVCRELEETRKEAVIVYLKVGPRTRLEQHKISVIPNASAGIQTQFVLNTCRELWHRASPLDIFQDS